MTEASIRDVCSAVESFPGFTRGSYLVIYKDKRVRTSHRIKIQIAITKTL